MSYIPYYMTSVVPSIIIDTFITSCSFVATVSSILPVQILTIILSVYAITVYSLLSSASSASSILLLFSISSTTYVFIVIFLSIAFFPIALCNLSSPISLLYDIHCTFDTFTTSCSLVSPVQILVIILSIYAITNHSSVSPIPSVSSVLLPFSISSTIYAFIVIPLSIAFFLIALCNPSSRSKATFTIFIITNIFIGLSI